MENKSINISYHSGIYTLEAWQTIDAAIGEAWDFFSDPSKLAEITPPYMGFRITSGKPAKMYQGQIISYRIGIFPLIRSSWVTEISSLVPGKYFVDKQISGPYKIWHHEHHFTESGNSVNMYDRVSYKIPLGAAGRLIHFLFIRKKLLSIFSFRHEALNKSFYKNKK